MAGMPPWSVPAGTISGLKGLDLSPWFQNEQLNFQRQMAMQQLAQQNQAAIAAEQSQKAMQDYRERMGTLELKAAGEQATEARKERMDTLALTAREAAAGRDVKMRELGLKEREINEKVASEERAQRGKLETLEFTAKQQEKEKSEFLALTDAKARARAAVVARASQLAQQTGDNPEAVRDMLLQETLTPGMEPNDRIASQEAIGEWYKDAVAATKRKAVDAEEANRAKEGALRLKLAEDELDRKKKQDEFKAAAQRAAPLVREREALSKRVATIDNQIVALTSAVASAPNDAVRAQRQNMLAQYQQAKADLEAAIAKKDAEINQRMGLTAGPAEGEEEPFRVSPTEWQQAWKERQQKEGAAAPKAETTPAKKQDNPAIVELKRRLEAARKAGDMRTVAQITRLLEET